MQNSNAFDKGMVNKISQWDVARATRGHFIHGQKCLHCGQMALVVLYLVLPTYRSHRNSPRSGRIFNLI